MGTKQELIAELRTAHHAFRSTLDGLDERQFDTKWLDGRWGAREIVAHHTGWLGQLGGGLERMARGERPTPEGVDWTEVDHWNETFAEHAKGKQKNEVLDELEHAMASFIEAANKLPDDRFGEGSTAAKMFDAAGISHFRESASVIRRWRETSGAS